MTVVDEISALRERIDIAYDHISAKGGTVPAETDSWHLSGAIDSIPTGGATANFYGISSLAQVFPLSIDVETGRWYDLPNEQLAATFTCPVKKVIGPYSNLTSTTAQDTQPRGFRNMFGIGSSPVGTSPGVNSFLNSMPASNAAGIRRLYGYLPNVSAVEFPELTQVSGYSLFQGFATANDNMRRFKCPKLSAAWGACVFSQAFSYARIYGEDIEAFFDNMKVWGSGATFDKMFYVNTPPDRQYHVNIQKYDSKIIQSYSFYMTFGWTNLSAVSCTLSSIGDQTNRPTATFSRAFAENPNLRSIEFPDLLSVVGSENFYRFSYQGNQTNSILSSVSFPKLKMIQGSNEFGGAFVRCIHLSSIEFPELLNLSGTSGTPTFYTAFNECSALTSVSFPKLSAINATTTWGNMRQMVNSTTRLPRWKLYMPAIKTLTFGTANNTNTGFSGNRGMTDIYLSSVNAITNNYGFVGCNELTGIHFAADNETAIKATSGYATLWGRGAGAATVFWDL